MKSVTSVAFVVALAIGITDFRALAAQPQSILSKKEVKALIRTAKTSEDHLKLAQYYHYEADKLRADAKDHEEMGAEYSKDPSSHPIPKYPTLGQHCRSLSLYYAQAAKKAEEMAVMHEEMAKHPQP